VQWRGPREFCWRHVPLTIEHLPRELEGLRILHLSDFHTRHYWPAAYDTLLEGIAADPPDLILFTGDFVESKRDHLPAVPHVRRLVEGFHARLGVFGTLGNHDLYDFAPHLDSTKVELIEHQRRFIQLKNAGVEVIGLPGVCPTDLDPNFLRRLPLRAPRTVRIVMSHFPDHLTRTRHLHPDLFLCGHTHGGQVCLPGGYPVITHSKLPRPWCRGVHQVHGRTWLVVNHGLGFSGLPLRVNCPAEVVELTLVNR
jgi:predicted MPP superfamily phosphohydrolase